MPGFWILLKLLAVTFAILVAFVLLGEFSSNEIVLARSMLPWQAVRRQNPREV